MVVVRCLLMTVVVYHMLLVGLLSLVQQDAKGTILQDTQEVVITGTGFITSLIKTGFLLRFSDYNKKY